MMFINLAIKKLPKTLCFLVFGIFLFSKYGLNAFFGCACLRFEEACERMGKASILFLGRKRSGSLKPTEISWFKFSSVVKELVSVVFKFCFGVGGFIFFGLISGVLVGGFVG